jgi:hypothetical protein
VQVFGASRDRSLPCCRGRSPDHLVARATIRAGPAQKTSRKTLPGASRPDRQQQNGARGGVRAPQPSCGWAATPVPEQAVTLPVSEVVPPARLQSRMTNARPPHRTPASTRGKTQASCGLACRYLIEHNQAGFLHTTCRSEPSSRRNSTADIKLPRSKSSSEIAPVRPPKASTTVSPQLVDSLRHQIRPLC